VRTRMTVSSVLALMAIAESAFGQAGGINGPAKRADLRLESGSLDKYVAAVRGKFTEAKIVIDGESVGNTVLPKVDLPRASLSQMLLWVPTTAAARKNGVTLQPSRSTGDSAEIYVFTVARAPVEQAEIKPAIVTKDYGIDSMPEKDWPETLRLAVVGKLKRSDPKQPAASVELTDTKPRLLRVRGTQADIRDADQTISTLENSARERAPVPQLQRRIDILRTQVDSLRERLSELEKRAPKPS
jgi:hypothetical protein